MGSSGVWTVLLSFGQYERLVDLQYCVGPYNSFGSTYWPSDGETLCVLTTASYWHMLLIRVTRWLWIDQRWRQKGYWFILNEYEIDLLNVNCVEIQFIAGLEILFLFMGLPM